MIWINNYMGNNYLFDAKKNRKNQKMCIFGCADGRRCAVGHRRHRSRGTQQSGAVPTAAVAPWATVGTVQTAP
jgi:hypothetical protein